MTPAPSPKRMCPRCKEFKRIAPGAEACNDCAADLAARYARIDRSADQAKQQAYKSWINDTPDVVRK